jgi:ubiquinone/menaquinone biosynthesis C-methylase UbiE
MNRDRLLELTAQAEAEHFWFQGFRSFITPVIADLARGRPDLTLLDCGCGTGTFLKLFDHSVRTFGFDVVVAGVGGRVVQADVLHIPFEANTFDIATSFDMLQCVEADLDAVREMTRVVRPGGAVVLTVAALEMLRGDHSELWREFRRYSPSMVRQLVEQTGLRVERVAFLFASLFPLMLAVRMTQRMLRLFREVHDDTDIRIPPAPVNALLTLLLRKEAAVAERISMPFGSSLLVVARKPMTRSG